MDSAAGFRFFSTGNQWENAFSRALEFLEKNEGTIVLGAGIGFSGQLWIQEELLKKRSVFFGNRILPWKDFVQNRARTSALSAGRAFKAFNQSSYREFARGIFKNLESTGAFSHISGLWKEDRFFEGFLRCVEEARAAGLIDRETIERAFEKLKKAEDPIYREVYRDLEHSLIGFEAGIRSMQDTYDFPRMLQEARDFPETEKDVFCLGFDSLCLLEADLLQSIAQRAVVHLPLSLDGERAELLRKQKAEPNDLTEAAFFTLCNSFSGNILWENHEARKSTGFTPVLLEAHSPATEMAIAAKWAEECLLERKSVRIIGPKGFLKEFAKYFRFAAIESPVPLKSHALMKTIFHALRLKTDDFPVASVVELASFLHSLGGDFSAISRIASESGIRKGLSGWKKLSAESKSRGITEFTGILESLAGVFPAEGNASEFQAALLRFVKILQLGKLADQSFPLREDTGTHAVIAALLRFSQMLGASVNDIFLFEDWLKELELLVDSSIRGEDKSYPGMEFYSYGEWLPPPGDSQKTLAIGFSEDLLKRRSFQFFFEEGARRRLQDLLLSSQLAEEAAFLRYTRKLLTHSCVFSRHKIDASGREVSANAVVPLLDFSIRDWPQISLENRLPAEQPKKDIQISLAEQKRLSASLLEQYKECPFKAYTLKILKLEDSAKSPSLDVGALDLGSLSHRILELFYGKYEGKSGGLSRLEANLSAAIEEAVGEVSLKYFKGGEFLWNAQLLRLKGILSDFLKSDLEFYSNFPDFDGAEFEKKLSGKIGDVEWTGKADRIDYDLKGKRFLVMDYKSGSVLPPTKDIEDLKRFQIPLYIEAIRRESGMEPIGGLYVSLKSGKRNQGLVKKRFNRSKKSEEEKETTYFDFHFKSGCLKTDEDFTEILNASTAEMKVLSERIQKGEFAVQPSDESKCKKCEVRPACRIRSLEEPAKAFSKTPEVSFFRFSEESLSQVPEKKKAKQFNEEQLQALSVSDRLVFVEASAGTGKTTVIVEKIQRFLESRLKSGVSIVKAAECFTAISFTEKSTEELRSRLSRSLCGIEGIGTQLAVHAKNQVSTIHGFCKKVISDFPLESGIPPMAELMDEREKEVLLEEVLEDFFTEPDSLRRSRLEFLFRYFDRAETERLLRTLQEKRLLWKTEISGIVMGLGKPEVYERAPVDQQVLFRLLELQEDFEKLYRSKKNAERKLDFNDLEEGALEALKSPMVALHYQKKFDLVLVDEFQDTNSVQREILERLARKDWSNFFVVGDAKQSIYRFRAADVGVFQSLRAEAGRSGALVSLFRNYRSRSELVETSNRISRSIFPEDSSAAKPFEALYSESFAGREAGGQTEILSLDLPEKTSASQRRNLEAVAVAKSVKAHIQAGVEPSEIAILLRKISGNEMFLKALTDEKIPFRVGSSKGFYSQPVIIDALALLRALFFPFHALSVFALLRSPFLRADDQWIYDNVRGRQLDSLFSLVEEKSPALALLRKKLPYLNLSEVLREAFQFYPYDQREAYQLEKLSMILDQLEEKQFPKLEIVERVSAWAGWASESDADDDSTMPEPGGAGAVSVMTVHSSKGLEFDLTLLPDLVSTMSANTLPLRGIPGHGIRLKIDEQECPEFDELKELEKQMEIAEWKRLFYVAFTRAKEKNIFVLPKTEGKIADRWGDYLRLAKVESSGLKVWEKEHETLSAVFPVPKKGEIRIFPKVTTSISEIAANRFCPEFHRRKYVAGWDDLVVELLPKPVEHLKKPKKYLFTATRASKLLRSLGLENKERGIALHRVLERIGLPQEDRALWLREAYISQGAPPEDPRLEELIEEDLSLLEHFIHSEIGGMIFDRRFPSFSELGFRWRQKDISLFGTIDRLVKRSEKDWVLVDYKSSLLEDSLERYRFQVESYMCAVHALSGNGAGEEIRITGYLVDLSSANALEVKFDPSRALRNLQIEMEKVALNQRIQENVFDLHARGIQAGDHCFSCAYSLHCDLGTKFVLAFQ